MTLWECIAKLPLNYYVQTGQFRPDEEPETVLLHLTIMESPPKDGWPSRGAYFNHPQDTWGRQSHEEPCPKQWRYDDAARVSVTADCAADLERLAMGMLGRFLEKVGAT